MDESENMGQGGATRRAVLAGLAGATAIAALPVTVSAGIAPVASSVPAEMPASFLTASSKLCGLPLDKSYIELAGTIWKTLTTSGDLVFQGTGDGWLMKAKSPDTCRIAGESGVQRSPSDSPSR